MSTDDENERARLEKASLRFDDAPERFRAGHSGDRFAGASGVLFEQAMAQTRMAICLCDPNQDDLPIVFANRAFRRLTGYAEDEILGRNCRFLQGQNTDPEAVARIRKAITNEDVIVVELLNYRKNGTSFWNALHLGPIYNEKNELVYFFGSQWDVSDMRAARAEEQHARDMSRELSHRMKNMFAVISGIVNVTGRVHGIEDEASQINSRIQALGRAYDTTIESAMGGNIDIGQAIRGVMSLYGNGSSRLVLDGSDVHMPFTTISVVGLILHELAANATKYGAWSSDGSSGQGQVSVSWHAVEGGTYLEIVWKERGGRPVDDAAVTAGTGTAIVDRLLAASSGSIERRWDESGLTVSFRLPTRNGA